MVPCQWDEDIPFDDPECVEPPPPAMQSFTLSKCSSLALGEVVILRDIRNNQDYRIKKLPDGKCWMIDNLKLAGVQLTNYNTNILAENSPVTLPAPGTNSNGYDVLRIWDPGASSYCAGTNGDIGNGSITGCGYLYNFYTATATTAPQSYNTYPDTAAGDICPANWRLPKGGAWDIPTNEFYQLNAAMHNNGAGTTSSNYGNSAHAVGWQLSGNWQGAFSGLYNSGFISQGSSGYFWSSTVSDANTAHSLQFDSSSVIPATAAVSRSYGFSARCLMSYDRFDLNQDGKVSLADMTYAQVFNNVTPDNDPEKWEHVLERGIDMNYDGVVDISDIQIIVQGIYN
jgi:uncharacterized protein (TIGR02145 family)